MLRIKLAPRTYPHSVKADIVIRNIKSNVIRHFKECPKEEPDYELFGKLYEFAGGVYDEFLKVLYYDFIEHFDLPSEDFERAIEWLFLRYIKKWGGNVIRELPPRCLAVLARLAYLFRDISRRSIVSLFWPRADPLTLSKLEGHLMAFFDFTMIPPVLLQFESPKVVPFHLNYIEELSLAYWDGDKWQITELGELLLRIPPKHFPEVLLYLETKLSKGTMLCMSKSFIETLYRLSKEKAEISIHELEESMSKCHRLIIKAWLMRLDAMGLLTFDYMQEKAQIKQQSLHIFRKVIEEEGPLFTVMSSLIHSTDPPMVVREDVAIDYLRRNINHPLLKALTDELEQALKAYETGNYMTALRALLPVIEKIVREIYIKEKIGGTSDSLNTMAKKLTETKLISEGTEGLIRSLRRNEVAHGLWPPSIDDARLYSLLALITILELIRDYERCRFLREVLNEIRKMKNYAINVNELLKAYPHDRRKLHVEWMADNRLRITLRGEEIYEAIREDDRLSVKRIK